MNRKPSNLLRKLVAGAAALAVVLEASLVPARADDEPAFIRDAEIEGLMRIYTRDVFQAAGLNPGAVHVYLINNSSHQRLRGGRPAHLHPYRTAAAGQDAQRGDRRAGA